MNTNVTVTADQWWSDVPTPRKMLAMYCLLISREDHPAFHWNGETGDLFAMKSDGTTNYEMTSPSLDEFRSVLLDLKENWPLYDDLEINFKVPLEFKTLTVRIRLEQRDLFPHLHAEVIDGVDEAERDRILKAYYSGEVSFEDPKRKRITIRGKVLDHKGDPVAGVRLADRKSNWPKSMIEEVEPGGLASQVVFSDENGKYELNVELMPGFLDLKEVVVVYKAPSIVNWLKSEFEPSDIEANPEEVNLHLPEPGSLKISYDFTEAIFADCEYLQIGIFKQDHYHREDIGLQGELHVTGLAEGEYQVGVGATDSREQLISKSVEVQGSKTTQIHLEPKETPSRYLRVRVRHGKMTMEQQSESGELSLELYADPMSLWSLRAFTWTRDLSSLEFDAHGVFETSIDVSAIWNRNVKVWFRRLLKTAGKAGWNDAKTISLYNVSHSDRGFGPLLQQEFEDGTVVELFIDKGPSESSRDPSDSSSDASQWWNEQSEQRRIFNRMLITAIRQGYNSARWGSSGQFSAYPDSYENQINLHHQLGYATFEVVLRELAKSGLSADHATTLAIPMVDDSLSVNVTLHPEKHISTWIGLSWQTVDDAKNLLSLEELESSFPKTPNYRLIRGRVVDHLGEPVSGAWVVTENNILRYGCSTPEEGWNSAGQGRCLTNDNGEFELPLIQCDDGRRMGEGVVLVVQNAPVNGAWLKLDGPIGSKDINGVEIQLPKPAELIVQCELKEVDDVVAPLRLHIRSATHPATESRVVQATGETRFPNLTSGKWLVSIHQMGNDLARVVVDLNSASASTVLFDSTAKLNLIGELVYSEKPAEGSSLLIRFNNMHHSPFVSFRENENFNFDFSETIELDADKFEAVGDQWKSEFVFKNVVGGIYELDVSTDRAWEDCNDGWKRDTTLTKRKVIQIEGNPPEFEPIDLEWEIEGSKIQLSLKPTNSASQTR